MYHPQAPDTLDHVVYDTTVYAHRTPQELQYLSQRNLKELTLFIQRIFDHHSRVLVVRVDLRYKKDYTHSIPIETVMLHRKHLLEDRRNYREFDGLIGYAWGFEYAEQCGPHFHLLAIYDSALLRDDIGLGLAIRDRWISITGGHGDAHVSNLDKAKFSDTLGIGVIRRDDVFLRSNLIEFVAAYITKRDSVAYRQPAGVGSVQYRAFGRSRILPPLDPNMPRRGRPPVANRPYCYS